MTLRALSFVVLTGAGTLAASSAALELVKQPSKAQMELRVPAEFIGILGRVSPDGRELPFAEPDTGDLAVWFVDANEKRAVAKAACTLPPIWSPDGKSLACGWRRPDGMHELRLVERSTGRLSVVFRHDGNGGVTPLAWSPDGRSIAVALTRLAADRSIAAGELSIVRVADRNVRTLLSLDGSTPEDAAFSPDGRHVAYDYSGSDGSGQLFVVSEDGSGNSAIPGEGATNQWVVAWLPDGRLLVTSNHRSRAMGLWAISMQGRTPTGAAQVLENVGSGLGILGMSADGRLFVKKTTVRRDVYLAELDSKTGRALAPPSPLPGRPPAAGRKEPVWSPEGSRLAYVEGGPGAPEVIVVHTIATGEMRRYELPVWNPDHMLWLPDGLGISMDGLDTDGAQRSFRLDLATGKTDVYTKTFYPNTVVFGMSANGQYAFEGGGRGNPGLFRHHLGDGTVERLTADRAFGARLSPDGRWLAYLTRQRNGALAVVPASGGAARVLVANLEIGYDRVTWSADSRYVIFQSPPIGVHRVSVDGGAPEPLGIPTDSFRGSPGVAGTLTEVGLSSDGRHLVLDLGRFVREVWVWQYPAWKMQ